jgi:hypothetical protein
MGGLDCYGSSDGEEVEAQTTVKAAVQPEIEMAEMASLPAAVSRAAERELEFHGKYKTSYLTCDLVQLYNPSYVAERSTTVSLVARLAEIKPFGERPDVMARLQRDLPT